MDQALANVLLGVLSNGLTSLTEAAARDVGISDAGAVASATARAVARMTDIEQISDDLGGERLRAFLESPEASLLVAGLFTRGLYPSPRSEHERRFVAMLGWSLGDPDAATQHGPRLFRALEAATADALGAGLAAGSLVALDALNEAHRKFVVERLDALGHAAELLLGNASTKDDVEAFAEGYRTLIAHRTSTILPPAFEGTDKVPIDDLYVLPLVEAGLGKTESYDAFKRGLVRCVVLGDPGAGKSTLTLRLCHDLALEAGPGGGGPVPMLVVLRDFAAERRKRPLSLVDWIEETAHTELSLAPPAGAVERLLLEGRAVVVLDGLDELLDTSQRRALTALVESFCTRFPTARVLVTSRSIGYAEAPLDRRLFESRRLSQFSIQQVEEYAEKWFRRRHVTRGHGSAHEAANFMRDSEHAASIRSNPLMLALLCSMYNGPGHIPRNRPAVFERCAEMLFERWDKDRRIFVDIQFERHLRPAMGHLALWIFQHPDLQNGVAERALVTEAASYLLDRRFEQDETRAEAQRFVRFCRGRAWVFTDTGTTGDGEPLYQFTHRTFLEFFAAEHLVRTLKTPDHLLDELLPRIELQEWDAVAELAVQLMDAQWDGAGDEILQAVLPADEADDLEDSRQMNRVSFTARALSYLVPSRAVCRYVTARVVTRALDEFLLFGNQSSGYDGADIGHFELAQVSRENRATVADEIIASSRRWLEAHPQGADAVSELALNLDMASRVAESDDEETERWWIDRAAVAARELSGLLQGSARGSADLVRLGVRSVADHVAAHGVNSLFESHELYLWAGYGRVSLGEILVLHPSHVRGDGSAMLQEMGATLLRVPPPWGRVGEASGSTGALAAPERDGSDIASSLGWFAVFCVWAVMVENSARRGGAIDAVTVSPTPLVTPFRALLLRRLGATARLVPSDLAVLDAAQASRAIDWADHAWSALAPPLEP